MFRNKTDSQKIAKAIGYEFKKEHLLLQALTRTSALGEGRQRRDIGDFQRLEFVGDKVLGLVISDLLYDCHPTWKEGQLTQHASELVRNKGPLAEIARTLGLGDFLIMGRGEELLDLREDDKVLSDAMEALLGALWIDTGHDYTFMRQFIQTHWSALGLLPTVKYEQLIQLLHDEDMSTADKVAQLKKSLQGHVEVPVLNQFLLDLIAQTNEEKPLSEIITAVLEKGADPNPRLGSSHFSPLQTVLTQFDSGETRTAVVQSLLHHRADPNWRNQSVRRKLLPKARLRDEMEQLSAALAEELSGVSPIFDGCGEQPLTIWDFVKGEKKEEPMEDYQPRKTALHYACEQEKSEEIIALLDAGADTQLQDADGNTPLHLLIRNDHMEESDRNGLIHALLNKSGTSLNQQNNDGNTPFHLYIHTLFRLSHLFNPPSFEVLSMFVEAKADITLVNRKGNTILHEIAYEMHTVLELGWFYYERCYLIPLVVMDELPNDDLFTCMEMKNKSGETPRDFFKKMFIPKHLGEKLLSPESNDDEEFAAGSASIQTPSTHRAEADNVQSLAQQLAAVDLAAGPTSSRLVREDRALANHGGSVYGGFFPVTSRPAIRPRPTRNITRVGEEKDITAKGVAKLGFGES